MLHPQSGRIWVKAFQKVHIPHKTGMFVRHQKATAHWCCSLWPNMEGKNAAFSRNQTGKKKKKGKVFLHAVCTARYSSHTHYTVARELAPSENSKTDGDVGPAMRSQLTRTQNTHTCTDQGGTPIFSLHWHVMFRRHTKAFFSFTYELESQQCTLNRSPLEGNIPLGEKAAVSNPTVLLKLETVCLSAPTAYMLWHSPAIATLSICLCHFSETSQMKLFGACVN